jgi:hypothetical protein
VVAEGIVYLLEAVQVDEQHGQWTPHATRLFQLGLYLRPEAAPIGETGQAVMESLMGLFDR